MNERKEPEKPYWDEWVEEGVKEGSRTAYVFDGKDYWLAFRSENQKGSTPIIELSAKLYELQFGEHYINGKYYTEVK